MFSYLTKFLLLFTLLLLLPSASALFSSRLIHRFSDELTSRNGTVLTSGWQSKKTSLEYYEMLMTSDVQRHKIKLGTSKYQFLFPSEGSSTTSFGNELGWLHYTWIDIGTPNVSFLVALDVGSDLLWVPCDCVQCAPLTVSYSTALDRDLNEYIPSSSTTSKHLPCSHQFCESGPKCESPNQPCPYTVNYVQENTSSSGLLIEDTLHLKQGGDDVSKTYVQARAIIGCGQKQSGSYLEGIAPDGLMGLGLGKVSVPSVLAKAGLVKNTFSMCFNDDNSGRIFFGDQGITNQQSTPFVPLHGEYPTYIIGVEASCIGDTCLKQSSFKAQVDSGTSFTFLPAAVYEKVVQEFDTRVNTKSISYEGSPWKYCYDSSADKLPKIPSVTFMFESNNSFVVLNPIFVFNNTEGVIGYCFAVQPADGDFAVIGQNFMTGYRMVFDRENLKLGWSRSNCEDISKDKGMTLTPPPTDQPADPLPMNDQHTAPNWHAVAPATAGRAPSKPSAATPRLATPHFCVVRLLLLLLLHLFSSYRWLMQN